MANCTKNKEISEKSKNDIPKLSTRFVEEKPKKWLMVESYAPYPHENIVFLWINIEIKRTSVLLRTNKNHILSKKV